LRHVKESYNDLEVAFVRLNLIGHFSSVVPPFADRGLSGRLTWSASGDDWGTKSGVSTISLGRLQCVRRDSAGPTEEEEAEEEKKNCFLKHVFGGNIDREKQKLRDRLNETRGHWKLKEEPSDQYNETKVMHFLFNLFRIKGLYMFQRLLAHLQEAPHRRHLVHCVRVMS
jgi:hypothetical protein